MQKGYLFALLLVVASFYPIYATWGFVDIKYPNGTNKVTQGALTARIVGMGCLFTGVGARQSGPSTCDWDYAYPIDHSMEGNWKANMSFHTRECLKSACGTGWTTVSGGCGCAGSDICCEKLEYTNDFVIWNIDWDTDSNDCTGYLGSGHWSLGGEVAATSCCGDDSSEYVRTESGTTDAPTGFKDGITTCCNSNTDCTKDDTCVATTGTNGTIPYKAYCNAGTWDGGDDSQTACNAIAGSGKWNLGGGTSGTTCCGDDSNENIITESGSTDTPLDFKNGITACCSASTDCNYNDACTADTITTGSVPNKYYCNAGTWDGGDDSQTACDAIVGSNRWNIGGEVSGTTCCEDDSGEYVKTETGNTDAPTGFNDSITTCCNSNTDCTKDDTCVATTGTSGTIPSRAYCNAGTWDGGDDSSTACTAIAGANRWNIGGEVSGTTCCEDDSGEYVKTETGTTDAPTGFKDGITTCCNSNTDCTKDDTCVATTGISGTIPSRAYCNAGTWDGGDDSQTACDAIVGSNRWNIGGEVSGTTCCEDDSGEYVKTETGNTDAPTGFNDSITTCCNSNTDCTKDDTCVATTGTSGTIPSRAYCNAGTWDGGDDSQTACDAIVGTSKWNLGGGTSGATCCGDDSNENVITESGSTDTPLDFKNGITACCSASTDCNYNDACTANTGTTGTVPNKYYCNSATWNGGDDSQTACTAIVGSGHWLDSACCGDDGTGEDYQGTSSCCINGQVIANNTRDSTQQFLCYNGLVYGCGASAGVGTNDPACTRRYGWYCDGIGTGANTWKDQGAHGAAADDCDGLSEDPYGEVHTTSLDGESCESNTLYNDWGSGTTNQDQGWKCNSGGGPYIAYAALTQNGATLTLRVDVADEADSYNSGGYIYRIGNYNTISDTTFYSDSGYPGTLYMDPNYATYSGTDANEGTYGDYFDVSINWGSLTTPITTEGTYYTEVGVEESAGTNCGTQTCSTEDPNDNEGNFTTSATLCVPTAYAATADSDCCPVGATTSEYPGKDDDGGACVRCNTVTKVQTEGATGNSQCEAKCGASSQCDEYSTNTCPSQGYICNSTCTYVDRDTNQTYCTDGTGCTAYSWVSPVNLCCGDDGAADDFENTGTGNSCCVDGGVKSHNAVFNGGSTNSILCFDGRIRSCNDAGNFTFDTDYSTGAHLGNNFCTVSGWSTSAPNYDAYMSYCDAGGYTWFGGSGTEACCQTGEQFVHDGIVKEGLIDYFKFDESTGTTTVTDSQSGKVGDLLGSPPLATIVTSSTETVSGNALSFDGTDDYIDVKTDPLVELDKNLTIAFWIKPNNVGSNRINPIDKDYGGEFALTIETNGALNFYHGTQRNGGYYTSFGAYGPGKIVNGKWQFVVITRNIATRNLTSYYNGNLEATYQYTTDTNKWPSVSTYDMTIGDGYVYNFGGVIDEVMLWNKTLSPDEVLMLYRSFPQKVQEDVIGYWNFDEGSGTVVKDTSSYGVDGSFYSDPQWTTNAKSGTALDFDGDASPNGDYISFPSNPSNFNINIGTTQTMSMWVKPGEANQTGYYFWKEGGCIGWSMYIESDGDFGCTLNVGNNTCTGYQTYTAVTQNTNHIDGNWHHVACVVDRPNNNMTLYVDGELAASSNVDNTLLSNAGSLRIGTQWNNANPYNGSIDEVVVYDDKLSYDEINYIYNLGKWNKFACDNGAKTYCKSGDECTKNVLDSGIANYCLNGYFTDYRQLVDTCPTACTDQGGEWLGGGSYKNCCISSQELWCNETVGVDTLCYGGLTYQCDFWCDILGNVQGSSPYTCTNEADGDCTSSQTCTTQNTCECFKSQGTTCTQNSECSTNNCLPYVSESISEPSLGHMWPGAAGSVCCPQSWCGYEGLNPPNTIDSCAVNTSTSIDADKDGDLDYCLDGQWKECKTYTSVSGKANECGCLGAGITINKSGTWECRVPPINLVYDGLSCGTACDSDSDLSNVEIVDGNGQCVEPDLSCSNILTQSSWTGNASLIAATVETHCPCSEDATCTFSVESNGERASINFPVQDATPTNQGLVPNFVYGENNVSISCTCSVVPAACSVKTPANLKTGIAIPEVDCVAGKTCGIPVNLSNLGGISTNNSLKFEGYLSSQLFANWTSVYLSKKLYQIFNFTNTYSCNWYQPTWKTGVGKMKITYAAVSDLPEVSAKESLNNTGNLIQCNSANDCTTCCSGDPSCWLNSSNPGDFACSNGVCCPSGEHFQNGACCIASERCCLDDLGCNTGEWCDNITVGFPNGNFICKDRKDLGQSCFTDRECLSGYCGDGICTDPEPVALSEWYECSPYLANDYCSYESVSGTYIFDPKGCNIDSDCSSNFYCYVPRRSCIACAKSDTVYNNLNISNDGLCPSVSCVGSDLDCCTQDSNCAGNEWCDASASCTACSDRSDSVCSSNSCVGTDPDCCNLDSDCGEGLKCVTNTCTGNVGEACTSDSTCTGGLKCLGGVCGKQSFIVLSPQEVTYTADLGTTLKLTLIVNDPQNKQDKYTVKVDQSYVPDSAYVSIDGVKSESFEMGAGEVRKFLVSVSAAKVKEGSPDIFTVLSVSSDTNPFISDSVNLQVDVNPTTTGNVPAAPVNAWFYILVLGFIIGIVKD